MEKNTTNINLATGSAPKGVPYIPGVKLADVEKFYILSSIRHFGSKKVAASSLGITHATLNNKLKQYGEFETYRKRRAPEAEVAP